MSGLNLIVSPQLEESGSQLRISSDVVDGAALVSVRELRYGSGQVRLTAVECEAAAELLLSAARTWRKEHEAPTGAERAYRPESEDAL